MNEYKKLYEILKLPDAITDLALGNLKFPDEACNQPALCYGFPPALLPIWSNPDAMIYTGYWKHWFSDRRPSFVRLYVNIAYRTKEIACDATQLFQEMILEELTSHEGVTDEVSDFAKHLGVTNVEELNNLSIDSGDDPEGLLTLPAFKERAPLMCFEDHSRYVGDFPHRGMALTYENMAKSCSLELGEILEKEFFHSPVCPPWFMPIMKKELFYQLLDDKKYADAWFTLNSNGWLFDDAKTALSKLAESVSDKDFHQLAESWLSLNQSKYKLGY
ncbi:MAG: hypothetical protein K2P84_14485 [Undibacterium sp.]|nr:hypothetical protein [Undibacterium sp.]